MAFKKTLAQQLFNLSKTWNPTLTNCRISSSSSALIPRIPANLAPDPGDVIISRRFLQFRPIYQSAASAPDVGSLPRGEKLLEKLRGIEIGRDRIRFDGLSPPPAAKSTAEGKLTVEDARKLLRVSQLEAVKSKLRLIPKDHIQFEEFVQICSESCGNREQGLGFAKMLDESGTVIVLGNVVFLRPDQEK